MPPSPRERRPSRALMLALVAATLALPSCGAGGAASSSARGATPAPAPGAARTTLPPAAASRPGAAATGPQHRMFAFYYLWWDTEHWHARLGTQYPYSASPLPLPATLDAGGCGATTAYPGNQLTDVASPLWTQDDPNQIRSDVALAARSGLAGFAVSWAGTGQSGQSAASSAFNRRLALLVAAVHQLNQAGTPFSLWIAYISSARIRTLSEMDNDLSYLQATYGADTAFDHANSPRPTLVMMGSRKYPQSVLDQVANHWRAHFYLVADENWATWNQAKAADFDADQYYWSSQSPTANARSFALVGQLAAEVRSSRNPDGSAKRFFSPLAPGYDKALGGGSGCVPRAGGQTMRSLYAGNAKSNPDGWMVISWNEIDEGTYIMPLERYGDQSLATLKSIIDGPATGGKP